MNLQEAVQYLMTEGYMVQIKGKYKVTAKFTKAMTGKQVGLYPSSQGLTVLEEPMATALSPQLPSKQAPAVDWSQTYIRFIQEAEVPSRGEGGSGSYDLNKFSEKAAKVFRRVIEKEGVIYAVLVKSTMLYYKTHSRYPVTITRYIEDGLWRTDYQALLESAKQGTVSDHIQNEIDGEKEFSKYRLG